jgi:WD40 repeat protein
MQSMLAQDSPRAWIEETSGCRLGMRWLQQYWLGMRWLHQWLGMRWLQYWSGVFLLALVMAGCNSGTPQAHFPLAGPGLHRAIARGSQGTIYSWWVPADARHAQPRVLLWDGVAVAVADPSGTDQAFTPLSGGLRCAQVALAPDGHAFACSQSASSQSTIFIKSLDDLSKAPQSIALGSASFTWAPDSRHLAYLHSDLSGTGPTCSVLVADTSADVPVGNPSVLLSGIPFNTALGEVARSCPVADLAWSPAGDQVAVTLATSRGVNLEVLHVDQMGTSATVEGVYLLPGIALQEADNMATPSLFWSSDGKVLAALTGYQQGTEDGLYLLPAGATAPLAEPLLTDIGEGAALAFSPDNHWLAVGTAGQTTAGENAILQVYDLAQFQARSVGEMLVVGSTLGWSGDSATLAAASGEKKEIMLWAWPDAKPKQSINDQDIAHLHQLAWSPDGTRLLFSEGSHVNGPAYDELYVQAIPVPPGPILSAVPPEWFADTLVLMPTLWLGVGGVILLVVVLLLLLVLGNRQLSQRARVLVQWTLGAGPILCGAIVLTSGELSDWLEQFYRGYSQSLCQSSPTLTCTRAGALSLLTLVGPLVLAMLLVVVGALIAGRRRPEPVRILLPSASRPVARLNRPEYGNGPLLLPPARTEEGEAYDLLPPWEDTGPPEQ